MLVAIVNVKIRSSLCVGKLLIILEVKIGQRTTPKEAIINDALWISKNTASCNIGFRYQGTFNDFTDLLDRKFADDLLVTCEYTEGVPMLGDFLPYIFLEIKNLCVK